MLQWANGERGIVGSYNAAGIYRVDSIDGGGLPTFVDEGYIFRNGYQTVIQPGQIYQALIHRYKVLAPFAPLPHTLSDHRWSCTVVSATDLPDMIVYESDILAWTLIEGLDTAPPPRQHGPHTCPRCGQGGALIMTLTVHCTNRNCHCFSEP